LISDIDWIGERKSLSLFGVNILRYYMYIILKKSDIFHVSV